jgi:hypothetical protein
MRRQGEVHGFIVDTETFQVVAHYRERIPRGKAAPIVLNGGELARGADAEEGQFRNRLR